MASGEETTTPRYVDDRPEKAIYSNHMMRKRKRPTKIKKVRARRENNRPDREKHKRGLPDQSPQMTSFFIFSFFFW